MTASCCATAALRPGTWSTRRRSRAAHVDAAAQAALLALTRGAPGIYNIAEDDGVVSSEKARRELGFDPHSAFSAASCGTSRMPGAGQARP